MIFPTTPPQTVGPYYAIGLPWPQGPFVVPARTPGAIRLHGSVHDGRGSLVPDHPDRELAGRPRRPLRRASTGAGPGGASRLEGFRGFGRCGREQGDGSYELLTVKPGRVPGPGGALQAPHIALSLFARGLLQRVVTRIYFADEVAANASDPILRVGPRRPPPDPPRASPTATGGYRFDIHLQGDGETVFFAL